MHIAVLAFPRPAGALHGAQDLGAAARSRRGGLTVLAASGSSPVACLARLSSEHRLGQRDLRGNGMRCVATAALPALARGVAAATWPLRPLMPKFGSTTLMLAAVPVLAGDRYFSSWPYGAPSPSSFFTVSTGRLSSIRAVNVRLQVCHALKQALLVG